MQKLKLSKSKEIIKALKPKIKGNIIDIFIIGSSIKNKLTPRDLDLIVLFKEKNMNEVQESLYNIKESLNREKEIHIEPIFAESIFKEKILLTVLHEGFSLKESRYLSEVYNFGAFSIFSFNLENLSKIDKVRFAQALYGRKKDGLLQLEKGVSLGQGSFMVNVEREEVFKELMKKWKINYNYKRAFVIN
ncbi:MAG: hypothetical protein WC533_04390 [Candidatus Pacearchaeota archaeon]